MARFLGLDIGGANLKISDGEGQAKSVAFPLWKTPQRLPETLGKLVAEFPSPDGFAVTMTGELADCFRTKAEGVDFLLAAVEDMAGDRPVSVWQTGAEFVPPDVAREIPLLVAAANWHALATFAGRMVPEGFSLLIDLGSTTADVIPILGGVPIPAGMTDCERLLSGELVYTGIRRTPLCAVSRTVPFRGEICPLAAEVFATMLDVYLVLGEIQEDAESSDTANGRPVTKPDAHERLARMICCDASEVSWDEAVVMAEHFAGEQRRQITEAIGRVLSERAEPCANVLVSGSGGFVIEQVCRESPVLGSAKQTNLGAIFEESIAESACAFSVARLAAERVFVG